MFDIISNGFMKAKNFLIGKNYITEENICKALEDVKISLLEADVEYNVVQSFLNRVKNKCIGINIVTKIKTNVSKLKLTASEYFIEICFEELKSLIGSTNTSIKIIKDRINTIMLVGLQGSGKTTSIGKLALLLKKQGHTPILVAADNRRAAAIEQLVIIGEKIKVPVFYDNMLSASEICKLAHKEAIKFNSNVILFDTAGKMFINDHSISDLKDIRTSFVLDYVLLVVDAMTGQDAVKMAHKFDQQLNLDGFILTKLDGDARGGAALSIKDVTGKPIKFLGVGEKLEDLEPLRADGLASRILGMGDIVGLVKDFKKHVNHDIAKSEVNRLRKGKFDLQDFLKTIKTINRMGPLNNLINKIPGFHDKSSLNELDKNFNFKKYESIILSMTYKERVNPQLVYNDNSRLTRIALGSGNNISEVIQLLQYFFEIQKIFKASSMKSNYFAKFFNINKMSNYMNQYKYKNVNINDYNASKDMLLNHNINLHKKSLDFKNTNSIKYKKNQRKHKKNSRKKNRIKK